MSKKVKCPSCDMAGDPAGDDYALVTTYHGRPILQCFWCDSHVMIRKMGGAMVLDLNHKAIRHLRSDLDHEEMVSLLLDEEGEDLAVIAQEVAPAAVLEEVAQVEVATPVAESELLVAATEVETEATAPKRKRARKTAPEPALQLGDFEPAMLVDQTPVDNTPALLRPSDEDYSNTPVSTEAELVSNIPVTARALDHQSLIHIAKQVGWTYTPSNPKYRSEWLNFDYQLPAVVELSPFRAKLRQTINMMKYFRVNAGSKEQRRMETLARRQRLVEYRKRMFSDKLEVLNAMQAIEYKPKTT
ncbi:MAG TPA: hypothetical protein VHI31_00115 [Actinomycetota bacterium]|nr:hypothetical protein [Actinomycetota bacterium]